VAEIALTLLPGLDGSGVLFRPLLNHLAPELRPIVVAYPRDKVLGYDELLPVVLASLSSPSPFVLLGESFSGPLALMAAATRPQGLRAVVLCASFVRNPLGPRFAFLRHFASPFAFRFYPAATRLKAIFGGYSTPEWRALKAEALSDVHPAVIAHRVRAVLQVDVRRELSSCPVPVLYRRGDRDRVVPGWNLNEILAIRPATKVAYFSSSHLVLQTQPALAAAEISTFIAGLDQRGG
jgi:pimeloyl-[acyl-carrier protein] methyl ester esterase